MARQARRAMSRRGAAWRGVGQPVTVPVDPALDAFFLKNLELKCTKW
jgi:hypothetical protein